MHHSATLTFGGLLKQLRKQAGMTQRDLAAALGYSDSLISSLEKSQRLPDLDAVMTRFIPALGLQENPAAAARLVELAATSRGERLPATLTLQRQTRVVIEEYTEERFDALPAPPTELIGRAKDVQLLCNRLLGHTGRLLTLVGPPGIGKTRLGLAVAAELQHHYADGAVFVPLASVGDAELMASTIALAVKSDDTSPASPSKKLVAFLRRKHVLLVLDNCEQIVGAAPLIADMLAACPDVCIVATSRERLHLRAEQRYRVPPLDLVDAVELFTQRASAIDADFGPAEENRPTIEAICQRLDRLPLALELCAAQIDLLSPAEILAQLQARPLDVLVAGAHDLPPEQRTLRAAIQRSYQLLTDDERDLFRCLGVFVSGWDLNVMEAVAGWRLEAERSTLRSTLHALIGKSLVRAETMPGGEQRFLMLETIREFALEQARANFEEELLRERHYAGYLSFIRTADSRFRRRDAPIWFARAEPELDNLRAALQWALDEQCYADAAWLVLAASWFWMIYGKGYESARYIQRLLAYRQVLNPDLRLAVMLWYYAFASHLEDFQPIDRYTNEIKDLLEVCSHPVLHAAAWHWIAETTPDTLQTSAASEQGIVWAREATRAPAPENAFGLLADTDWILAANLQNYARRLIEYGDFSQAEALSREALVLFRSLGTDDGIGDCLSNLGRIALLRGDFEQASSFLHEVIRYNNFLPSGSCHASMMLARIALYGGSPDEARRLLSESRQVALEREDASLLVRSSVYLAETALWEGKIEEAERWLADSFGHYTDPRWHTIDQVERLFLAARLVTEQGRYRRAALLFGLAGQLSTRINYIPAEPVRSRIDTSLATVRAAVDPAAFAKQFAAGQQLSLDEAFATVLAQL